MALTPEQVKSLKEQLISQIQNLPASQKEEAQAQIDSLSPEALELMLKQQQGKSGKDKGIFRMIIDKDIPSSLIEENSDAMAVLEINPISLGHIIIIPKTAAAKEKEIPKQAFTLAKKLSKKIISKLKAKSLEILPETKMGEAIINLIPVYNQPLNLNSPRTKASKESLEEISSKLKTRTKVKVEKIKITKKSSSQSDILKLPRRIP